MTRQPIWIVLVLVLCVIAIGVISLAAPRVSGRQVPSPLVQLADTPGRPAWAPIPMIKNQVGAVEPLKRFLKAKDAANRARAAFLIGQIGSGKFADLVRPLLQDKDSLVRLHAGIALAMMGDKDGIPGCEKALKGAPEWFRVYAVYGLWTIGSTESTKVLQAQNWSQAVFIRTMISQALETKAHKFDVKDLSASQPSAAQSAKEAWSEAASIYATESDWWFHHGDYNQCVRCSMTSAFFDPKNPENYSSAAYLLWSLGRNREADRMLADGVKAASKDPESYYNQGFHYFNTKRYTLAEAPLRKSVALGGDHRARRTYAHCLEKLGKLSASLKQWAELKKLRPHDGSVSSNYKRVLRKLGPTRSI